MAVLSATPHNNIGVNVPMAWPNELSKPLVVLNMILICPKNNTFMKWKITLVVKYALSTDH